MKYSKIDQFSPRYSILSSIILVLLLSSCSTTGNSKNDPLEPFNRAMFEFNEGCR
jgi:ABC-type transporter lipoprotein component MlaA